MKYIFLYIWYLIGIVIILYIVLFWLILNLLIYIWYLNTKNFITWRGFMVRKVSYNRYYTDVSIIGAYQRMFLLDKKIRYKFPCDYDGNLI